MKFADTVDLLGFTADVSPAGRLRVESTQEAGSVLLRVAVGDLR